jgi:hypothetical protein
MSSPANISPKTVDIYELLDVVSRTPGFHIERETFLRSAFREHCSPEQIDLAVETNPANAGISRKVCALVAKRAISHETNQVASISALAGMPGGWFMALTIPADMAQYFGHMIRVSQKLAYTHSWPALYSKDGEEPDDGTKDIMLLFLGVMSGVRGAQAGLSKASTLIAAAVAKKLPQQALTKSTVYPLVKKFAALLGQKMTKQIYATSLSKVVPVVGGLISGSVTFLSFKPMARKLNDHLAKSPLAKPRPVRTTPNKRNGDSAVSP